MHAKSANVRNTRAENNSGMERWGEGGREGEEEEERARTKSRGNIRRLPRARCSTLVEDYSRATACSCNCVAAVHRGCKVARETVICSTEMPTLAGPTGRNMPGGSNNPKGSRGRKSRARLRKISRNGKSKGDGSEKGTNRRIVDRRISREEGEEESRGSAR